MAVSSDPPADLRATKARLSPRLLALAGVSGLGISADGLTVYLVKDSEPVRREVAAVVTAEAPGTPVIFQATGPLRKQWSPSRRR